MHTIYIVPDSKIQKILDWLSPLNMYQKQQDTLSRRHGTTGSWLLNDSLFRDRIDSDDSHRTLWCPGDRKCCSCSVYFNTNRYPSGDWEDCHHVCTVWREPLLFYTCSWNHRSVVIDYLINNNADKVTKIAYLYCDYKDQAAQTAPNLIACLARQIIGCPEALPQQLVEMHKELKHQKQRPSFDVLKKLLIALCNQYDRTLESKSKLATTERWL